MRGFTRRSPFIAGRGSGQVASRLGLGTQPRIASLFKKLIRPLFAFFALLVALLLAFILARAALFSLGVLFTLRFGI